MWLNRYIFISLMFFIASCSSQSTHNASQYSQETVNAINDVYIDGIFQPNIADEAYTLAILSGDTKLLWQASMIKCKHDIHTCPDTVRLSKELTEHEQFMTFLNIFLCHGDQEALNSSILLASSNTEIEMIRALQNSNTLTSIDNLPPAILYFLGKESNNSHYINIAAEGFKRESNFRGQADALWLLAKQEMSNGNLTSAMNYGLESARILKAINEDSLASIVEFWIEQNTQ